MIKKEYSETKCMKSIYLIIFYLLISLNSFAQSKSSFSREEGVIPDIFIKDHLLDENDEILDGFLKRINKR